jgi:formate/nitrite transporter FocA (FNT family)
MRWDLRVVLVEFLFTLIYWSSVLHLLKTAYLSLIDSMTFTYLAVALFIYSGYQHIVNGYSVIWGSIPFCLVAGDSLRCEG